MSSFFKNFCKFANCVSTATFATGIDGATRQANKAFASYLEQSKAPNFRTCAEIDDLLGMDVKTLHENMHITTAQPQPEAKAPESK